ncbi:hypothetical protein LTR37_009320 [Vermiconidia calcicola]|uniref:Uncharacterized protein n=1 Tax=Vermiconidia calcicola TaxID=1690605 RepID=A0ACC3N8V1_9PEZI|nr:hypothetical protein LTR37_009320 [Vermiconidia calcicola]
MSTKGPTLKRILREASELASQPSPDYHAAPLETDLFEWHFTLRGPPAPSPFEGGIYHGRIILPPAYPLKPPSFRFLTPTGRFEVNREICLSISGHHEETWQPAWGIRTALVAIRSFMDTDAKGQLGGMDASVEMRRRLAGQSKAWKCGACGKTNEVVMREQEEAVREAGAEGKKDDEVVPEELRLAYREDLAEQNGSAKPDGMASVGATQQSADSPAAATNSGQLTAPQTTTSQPAQPPAPPPTAQPAPQAQQAQQQQQIPQEGIPPWIDKAIYGVLAALAYLLFKRFG